MAVAAALFAVGSISISAAEREGRGGREGERGSFGDRRQGSGGRASFMQGMSEEGRRAMMEAFREIREGGQELTSKQSKLRRELAAMITSGEVDEKAIRNKVMAIAEVEADMTIMRAKMFAKMKEAGVSDEVLKMMASRMGGAGPRGPGGQGGEGMRRGGFGGDRGGFSREGRSGFGDRDRGRSEREKPDAEEGKKRRPEFEK